MNEVRHTDAPPPAWKVWANPVFRRYCRSRLRPRGLGFSLLITLILSGFIFALARTIGLYRGRLDLADAERLPLIPLLVLQGLILFFLGTGQVAGGMTAEADEGVLDYQRLAPMSPLSKVLGYLFGLPVREWVMFGATLPFTGWCLWHGGVPASVALQLYAVVVVSAVLYHLTGLACGTVVKNRRWAFLVSIGIVFALYTAVPQLANFGLVYFRYLTLWPVFYECLPDLIPRDEGAALKVGRELVGDARFFNFDLPEAVFTLLSQGVLILTFIVMLWRRWRNPDAHLLGKAWAVGLFAWVQVLLLGNALPLIAPGLVFPSREFFLRLSRPFRFRRGNTWEPEPVEAVVMAGFFGFVSLAFLWVLTMVITPGAGGQTRGWRRAIKHGRTSLHPLSDPATAFFPVLVMAALGAAGWTVFARAVYESHWFPGHALPATTTVAFTLVFLVGGLGFHALLEGRGPKAVALAAIFAGIVPVMFGAIAVAVSERFAALAVWLVGVSPLSAPVYAAGSTLPVTDVPLDVARAMPRAFWFFLGTGALVTTWLVAGLRQSRMAVAGAARRESADARRASHDLTPPTPPAKPSRTPGQSTRPGDAGAAGS